MSQFIPTTKNTLKNTLPKMGDFLGGIGVDIIIYIVYIIFFRRDIPSTLFLM